MRIVPEHRRLVNIGQRFGRLEVIGTPFYIATKGRIRKQTVVLKCECGELAAKQVGQLLVGGTSSCGCLQRELVAKRMTKHGLKHTRLHSTWSHMRDRCRNNKAKDYRYYGGKGVRVCEEWQDFAAFHTWAIANGYENGLTIDRIDVNGNYEPSNCQWLTQSDNSRKRHVQNPIRKVAVA